MKKYLFLKKKKKKKKNEKVNKFILIINFKFYIRMLLK